VAAEAGHVGKHNASQLALLLRAHVSAKIPPLLLVNRHLGIGDNVNEEHVRDLLFYFGGDALGRIVGNSSSHIKLGGDQKRRNTELEKLSRGPPNGQRRRSNSGPVRGPMIFRCFCLK
jgi:hypothetical protein